MGLEGRVKARLNSADSARGSSTSVSARHDSPAAKPPPAPAATRAAGLPSGGASAAAPVVDFTRSAPVVDLTRSAPSPASADPAPADTERDDAVAPLPPVASAAAEAKPSAAQPRISIKSLQTSGELDRLELELQSMQGVSDAAEASLARCEVPLALRGELAQLHGSLNKLLATRLDAILTGDLTSGREEARARRKSLIVRCESLIECVEVQIGRIDALK